MLTIPTSPRIQTGGGDTPIHSQHEESAAVVAKIAVPVVQNTARGGSCYISPGTVKMIAGFIGVALLFAFLIYISTCSDGGSKVHTSDPSNYYQYSRDSHLIGVARY